VFGQGSDATTVHGQLDTLLRQKVAVIDLICELTDVQKQKLQLAGRGDMKRLIDRVEEIQTQLRLVQSEPARVHALRREVEALKRGLRPWFPNDGSLLDKSLGSILTTEQCARIATLQDIARLGGRVQTESSAQGAVLDVYLSGIPFADEGLASLKGLTSMKGLDLTSTRVTDAGLIHLEVLTKLQSLDLTATEVTDAGLTHLMRMTSLQRLDLFGTQVTAAGLAHLKGLASLKVLNLSGTRVTDSGLAHVKGLKNLQWFNLHMTHVTDAGLVHLKELTNLEWLDLSSTQVTDAGLTHVTELPNLKWINLSSTQVTDAGLADLKRALPTTNVWRRAEPASDECASR